MRKKNMKKQWKSLLALGLAALMLAGCGEAKSSVSTDTASSNTTSSTASMIDYVSQVHLTKEYSGKAFLTDGIGQVTLSQKVDGDTAHFKQISGSTLTIKGRYNCIDTPESTGMVEPWGHGASLYNGSLLDSAKTIVLSTDSKASKAPAVDSTGSRYLVYVWVSTEENAPIADLKLVNLALCQEGWSKAKGATGSDYGSTFILADAQASSLKLHVWSDGKDPDFNYDTPTTTTMKAIVDGVDNDGNAFDWIGAKATFTGIVCATGPDQGAAYVNKDFTWTDSSGASVTRRYGLYIFTSYIAFYPLKTIGNELQITGLVAEYEGVKQIVGVSYSDQYPSDDDMKILSTGNVLAPLTGTAEELSKDENINMVVTSPALTCTRGYATLNAATSSAYSYTLYCQDEAGTQLNIYIVDTIAVYYAKEFTYTDSEGTKTYKVGARVTGDAGVAYFKSAASITITGGLVTYTTTAGVKTYQVKLCNRTGLVLTF
jgi:endonuclease YncB( thermonuclease family)